MLHVCVTLSDKHGLRLGAVLLLGALLVLALTAIIFRWEFKKSQIARSIAAKGGRVSSIRWAPFGAGWFGEKNDTIFDVVYRDAEGTEHKATCKVSTFGAVYWLDQSRGQRG